MARDLPARTLHYRYSLQLANNWGHRRPLTLYSWEVLFCWKIEVSGVFFFPQAWAEGKQLSNQGIDQGCKSEGEFR